MKNLRIFPRFIRKRILKKLEEKERIKLNNQLNKSIKDFLEFGNVGVDENNELIVSLTSYPKRIPYISYTLITLLQQDLKPKKILLWLSKQEFPRLEQDLPKEVLGLKKCGLEIKWCDKNLYAFKKLIPALKEFPDSILVSADDDVLYPRDWLSKLYNAYKENPNYIHCHRAHKITFDKHGNLNPYIQWEHCIDSHTTTPSFLNFLTGCGGVIYPKNCFYQDILKEDVFMKLCPKADDIWFWAMAVLNDVKINVVEGNIRRIETSFMDFGEVGQLYDDNQKQNDIYLKNILDAYPKLREQIRFDSSEYWESRYKSYVNNSTTHDLSVRGGGGQLIGASGAGSYNNLAVFKAEILNAFVKEHSVQNVLEFGCGDGNQLKLAKYPYYVGLDVSKTAIECNVKQFANDTTKQFYVVGDYDFRGKEAELSLSLDVIYHLIQDEVFEDYMHNLFESSSCFVGIYASNKEEPYNSHVKHRKFSAWIEQNAKEWKLYRFIPNKYPFNEKNPNHTSFADFYFYKKDQ